MQTHHRRDFLKTSAAMAGLSTCGSLAHAMAAATDLQKDNQMSIGLVTYLWGQDWDLPTLIANCEKTKILGLELRTEHAHGVEPTLSSTERDEVQKRFADSPVELVGYGSNAQFHENDPAALKRNIELTKSYIKLMHDCGGSGVKVKPNGFVKGVPHEKTIEQIGLALREVAEFGEGYGQQIRVEVHGKETQLLPNIKAMMDVADHPNAKVCWNCNDQDLEGEGLEYNFNLVKDRFGATVHVREMNLGSYPYQELVKLLVEMDYSGWILLECRTKPEDRIAALNGQRRVLRKLVASAKAS